MVDFIIGSILMGIAEAIIYLAKALYRGCVKFIKFISRKTTVRK